MGLFHKTPWYVAGLAFECRLCGGCCAGPEQGYIWITDTEIAAAAKLLGSPPAQFETRYVKSVGRRKSLIENSECDCIFLQPAPPDRQTGMCARGCAIYNVRPVQCRTWPFWNANLCDPDAWVEAARRCPGINRGPLHNFDEIETRRRQSST